MLEHSQPRSSRGVSGDDPEGGAGRGVLRRRLVTVRLGRQGPRPPGTTTWVRGARCTDPEGKLAAVEERRAPKETEARPREPKIATVERREASVPRHGTQGASQAPGVPRHKRVHRPPGVPPSTRTSLGAPPTPRSGWRSKVAKPRARRHAPRERDGLFDIVRRESPKRLGDEPRARLSSS